ncbi:hypothetical protein [Nocardioides maradonensis]
MRLRLVVPALACAVALTGCGATTWRVASTSSLDSSRPAPAGSLTTAQARRALISAQDLGPGFTVDHSRSGGDDGSLGCLDHIEKLLEEQHPSAGVHRPGTEADASYAARSEIGLPFVLSAVFSMGSGADVTRALQVVESGLTRCRRVDTTSKDGTHVDLTVTTDHAPSSGATAQVNLTATGHMSMPVGTGSSITVPFFLRMSMAQVGSNLTMTAYGSMVGPAEGASDSEALDGYGIARLRAVMAGTPIPPAPDLGLRIISKASLLRFLTGGTTSV